MRRLSLKEGLIDFASNDYLGLAKSSLMRQRLAAQSIEQMGSSGSRLLTGNSRRAEELEQKIAAFHGFEAGLLFNCGYMANLGLVSGLASRDSTVLFDENVHASTRDGMVLSRAKGYKFRHNDANHLEELLWRATGEVFVCLESIYSTDGTRGIVESARALCKERRATLIVDEAHAVGVFGEEGRGLTQGVDIKVVTFGKALGTFGAIALGSRQVIQTLVNRSRSLIYTTALPDYALAAIECAYELFPKMERERAHLQELIARVGRSSTQIQPIACDKEGVLEEALQRVGVDARTLRSPTVREGEEVLRVSLHAFNTIEEVDTLLQVVG